MKHFIIFTLFLLVLGLDQAMSRDIFSNKGEGSLEVKIIGKKVFFFDCPPVRTHSRKCEPFGNPSGYSRRKILLTAQNIKEELEQDMKDNCLQDYIIGSSTTALVALMTGATIGVVGGPLGIMAGGSGAFIIGGVLGYEMMKSSRQDRYLNIKEDYRRHVNTINDTDIIVPNLAKVRDELRWLLMRVE